MIGSHCLSLCNWPVAGESPPEPSGGGPRPGHIRPTVNFFLTTAAGGIISAAGLIATSGVTEATALAAAAIIAPAFEPVARISLAAVNRHGPVILNSLLSAALGLILSAAGAVAGVVMISAGPFTQLAGSLVALQSLPTAASIGAALELGDGGLAARSLGRLAIDIGMVSWRG